VFPTGPVGTCTEVQAWGITGVDSPLNDGLH
jgi:hypothetical protein